MKVANEANAVLLVSSYMVVGETKVGQVVQAA